MLFINYYLIINCGLQNCQNAQSLASPTHIKDDQPAGGFTKSHRPWSVKRLVPSKSEKGHSWRSRDDHLEYQKDHQQIIATKWGDLGQTSLTIIRGVGIKRKSRL